MNTATEMKTKLTRTMLCRAKNMAWSRGPLDAERFASYAKTCRSNITDARFNPAGINTGALSMEALMWEKASAIVTLSTKG